MAQYRKKPVVIDAWQLSAGSLQEGVPDWINQNQVRITKALKPSAVISTLEGDMKAEAGDYIIRGVHGEFYPCKEEIFEATYDAVEDYASEEETLDAKIARLKAEIAPLETKRYMIRIRNRAEKAGLKLGVSVVEKQTGCYLIADEDVHKSIERTNIGQYLWGLRVKRDGTISEKGRYIYTDYGSKPVKVVGEYHVESKDTGEIKWKK